MNLLVTGPKARWEEWQPALSPDISATFSESTNGLQNGYDVLVDLALDENPLSLNEYRDFGGWIMGCAVKKSLQAIVLESGYKKTQKIIGINALPTFIGRRTMEFSFLNEENLEAAKALISGLGHTAERVGDRVGMVTPRLVFMIINEAFYTLQEGTAGEEDIDTGMKLGTNYPMGPFEWCRKAGIENVYETLDALWHDTRDERYKICALLKTRYMQRMLA